MAAPVDAPWAKTNATDADLNKTTYGQGPLFPTVWPVQRLFLRTDQNKIYTNIGTLNSPVFTLITGTAAGAIIDFAGPIAQHPLGYLRCNGNAVSRGTFSVLFAVIGTTYGVGDGSTTFNVPNLETDNKFTSAADADGDLNNNDGENTTTLTVAQLPSHNHPYVDTVLIGVAGNHVTSGNTTVSSFSNSATNKTTSNTGSGTSHNNRPSNLKVFKLIKT